jgi:hypothetical protein
VLGDDRFQVGADPVSQIGDLSRRRRIVAPPSPAGFSGASRRQLVVAGIRDRRAGSASRTVSPASSTTWRRPAERWGEAHATSTAATRAVQCRMLNRRQMRINNSPMSQGKTWADVSRERSSRHRSLPRGCHGWHKHRGLLASGPHSPSREIPVASE